MLSLIYPSGNREKSPASCLFTLNNPVPEEMRDATYMMQRVRMDRESVTT